MTTYTIGEVADRCGFSASALRYYEGIGLLVPSSRTEAGYRLYDDHAIARLAFIARAKQLGCSLEEIMDLVGIWDGERCGPVQRSFHELVTTKLADAARQISELTALSEQLRQAAAQLAGPAVDGPCSEGCACLALDRVATPIALSERAPGMTNRRGSSFSILGVGFAACVACCAPLLVGVIGSLGLAGLASTLFIGVGGLAITALAAAFVVLRRRHATCMPSDALVLVADPTRRDAPPPTLTQGAPGP